MWSWLFKDFSQINNVEKTIICLELLIIVALIMYIIWAILGIDTVVATSSSIKTGTLKAGDYRKSTAAGALGSSEGIRTLFELSSWNAVVILFSIITSVIYMVLILLQVPYRHYLGLIKVVLPFPMIIMYQIGDQIEKSVKAAGYKDVVYTETTSTSFTEIQYTTAPLKRLIVAATIILLLALAAIFFVKKISFAYTNDKEISSSEGTGKVFLSPSTKKWVAVAGVFIVLVIIGVSILGVLGSNNQSSINKGYSMAKNKMVNGNNDTITELVIEEGAKYIETAAFENYKNLKTVTLPSTMEVIGLRAFQNCTALESINIPSSVTRIRESAFYNCPKLTIKTLDTTNIKIETLAFNSCTIEDLIINNSNKDLNSIAFSKCVIKNAKVPAEKVSYLNGSEINAITISSGTKLDDGLLKNQTTLTKVSIPDSITTIGNEVFNGCSSLTSINIPKSVSSIGYNMLDGCDSLSSITVDSKNITFDSRENCNAIIETSTNTLLYGCNNTIIPSSITTLGSDAFNYKKEMTSIVIPSSVTSIKSSAFAGCESLKTAGPIGGDYNIQFGWTTEIPSNAFFYSDLEMIDIPNGITVIGDDAFNGCYKLNSVVIPESITDIETRAFKNCKKLESITYKGTIEQFALIAKGTDYKTGVASICVVHCTNGDTSF